MKKRPSVKYGQQDFIINGFVILVAVAIIATIVIKEIK